ncbi:MAG: baseplate J/gp47 family protein [Oscillospiraceae bacterium]|jgi:hypothetical protein|nr:baseplate J/gp47 family protein [Oscillospiraceae bacterium]
MIRLPNLDDQIYDDIVETARRRVMQYFPEWTNFNPSDPGVTIIELFAWLKEMQQYHLNSITQGGTLACLRLLGLYPLGASPAETTAVLKADEPYTFAEGFPFTTDNGLVFETDSSVTVGTHKISDVWLDTGDGPIEISSDIYNQGLAIEPFGASEKEDSCLYIGFDNTVAPTLRLYFQIFDDYPVKRIPFGDDIIPSRDILWTYGDGIEAKVLDKTRGFSVSGEVTLNIDKDWTQSAPLPEMPARHWICARLVGHGAEEVPKITGLFEDFVKLRQCETLSRCITFTEKNKVLTLTDYIGVYGEHTVFTPLQDGWKHMPGCKSMRYENHCEISVKKAAEYRIVSVKTGFDAAMSTVTNLPGTRLKLPSDEFVENIALMIENKGIWQDWEYVEQLHTAGPYDRVFTVDGDSIVFGDNEHGACPPAGLDNVIISSCKMTQGTDGNVLSHTLSSVQSGNKIPAIDNITAAEGGRDAEGLPQALANVSKLLTERNRSVTREDYEAAAKQTPGTRIIKTRAVEGYDPKTGGMNIPALVTVVVQPYGASSVPMPDERLLSRIKRHLETGRLLGVRVEVTAPEYVPIFVRIEAVSAEKEPTEKAIREQLLRYLSPTEGELCIGATLTVSDVSAIINKCSGVSRVSSVTLSAPPTAAAIDRSGSVLLPAHVIAYAGDIDIHIKPEG